jgi:5S rRNA maturation endonuclease (ribonuclease M5)
MSLKELLNLIKTHESVEMIFNNLNISYKVNGNQYRFNSLDGNNITACVLDLESLRYKDFKHDENGDIIDLICKRMSITKDQSISLLMSWLRGTTIPLNKENKKIKREDKELVSYPSMILDSFTPTISDLFIKDNINMATQIVFDIRYDDVTNRILIPIYQFNTLVGLIGRLNKENLDKNDIKYYPLLPYPKSKVLFGYDINISDIKSKKYVILVESEKSVLKAYQLGIRNVLAIGGSSISKYHIELLKQNGITNVIILFDQDKNIKEIKKNIDKFENIEYIIVNSSSLKDKSCLLDEVTSKKEFMKFIKKYGKKY